MFETILGLAMAPNLAAQIRANRRSARITLDIFRFLI
jgi:hypothetical protein